MALYLNLQRHFASTAAAAQSAPWRTSVRSISDTTMVSINVKTQPPRDPNYRVMTPARMNAAVQEAAYAVRGAIPLRSEELREDLEAGKQLPFDKVISCNIGNPQQLGQKPLTYLRQVSSESSLTIM